MCSCDPHITGLFFDTFQTFELVAIIYKNMHLTWGIRKTFRCLRATLYSEGLSQNCVIQTHNTDFFLMQLTFLRIVRYKLLIVSNKIQFGGEKNHIFLQLQVYISKFWLYNLQSLAIMILFLRIASLYLIIQRKGQNCEFISCNSEKKVSTFYLKIVR